MSELNNLDRIIGHSGETTLGYFPSSQASSVQYWSEKPKTNVLKALFAAMQEMEDPKEDSANTHFKNKYASIASVMDAVRGPLRKHGLLMLQPVTIVDGVVNLNTQIFHIESGEELSFTTAFPVIKDDAHGAAGGVTYARRVGTCALFNLVGDEDDDGNAAAGLGSHKPSGSGSGPFNSGGSNVASRGNYRR